MYMYSYRVFPILILFAFSFLYTGGQLFITMPHSVDDDNRNFFTRVPLLAIRSLYDSGIITEVHIIIFMLISLNIHE